MAQTCSLNPLIWKISSHLNCVLYEQIEFLHPRRRNCGTYMLVSIRFWEATDNHVCISNRLNLTRMQERKMQVTGRLLLCKTHKQNKSFWRRCFCSERAVNFDVLAPTLGLFSGERQVKNPVYCLAPPPNVPREPFHFPQCQTTVRNSKVLCSCQIYFSQFTLYTS